MPMTQPVSLRQVKGDWLKVRGEMAWVRLAIAAHRAKKALLRNEKFNPYHDELGRFTTSDGAVSGGRDGGVPTGVAMNAPKLALAGPAEKAIEAALAIFTFLSGQNNPDQTPFVQFNAQVYLPGVREESDATRVGSLTREEVDANCPRHGEVQSLTDAVTNQVREEGNYWGSTAFGTRVHSALKARIEALGDPNLRAEVSAMKSDAAGYGKRGSVRVDVLENVGDGTVCVYDIKTGKSGLTLPRMQEIANNVHSLYVGTKKILVIETRPK